MGFQPKRTLYNLVFDGTPLEGLHIRVYAASMDDRLHAFHDLAWNKDDVPEEGRRKQTELFELFIAHVAEWNLEQRDGTPAPVTLEALYKACEPEQVGMIVGVWQSGRQKVAAPLDQESPGSSLSAIPMTVLRNTPAPV